MTDSERDLQAAMAVTRSNPECRLPWPVAPEERNAAGSGPDLTRFLPNDHGNACRLIAMYGSELRFCHAFKKWLVWDGRRWAIDTTDQARRLAKHAMLETLRQTVQKGLGQAAESFARHSLDARRISSLLSMAEPEIYVTPEKLDRAPYLLNFENGTVDLRTGRLNPHRREDLLTKALPHRFRLGAECPTFARFLDRILGNDGEPGERKCARSQRLSRYLQKALGYSLTGVTSEKVVFIAHGTGNNGKTTLLTTLLRMLGEYGASLQIDTLMTRQENSNTQADLADLRGARFVVTSETEEGQRLAEGKLKRITQGSGRIKAVRKYENPIEFEETHKLWMDANHLPVVRGADVAIWNRLRVIPFEVMIPAGEIDRELPSKLFEEAEGILAWAVRGAVAWYGEGLASAPKIDEQRHAWRVSSDQIGRFLEEACQAVAGRHTPARELYGRYRAWAEAGGESVLSETAFDRVMTTRGLARSHTERGRLYRDLALRESTDRTGI